MSEKRDRSVADRRSFLKLAGLGAAGGAVALATGGTSAEAEASDKQGGALYRETDHVKKFYETARF